MDQDTHATETRSFERICTLLSDRRRRRVDVLVGRESTIGLHELAAAGAAREATADEGSAATDDVAVALHRVHPPKLDRADVVDSDPETGAVVPVRTTAVSPFPRPSATPGPG